MQLTFDLEAEPLLPRLRDRLLGFYGPQQPGKRMDPLSQMIKSVVSSRTYDAVSWAAFLKLREAFPDWGALADTSPKDIEAILAPVTHAEAKARQLPVLIRVLKTRPNGLDLSFLGDHIVDQAMAWLRELPGVGPKSAAATLNFSTLNMRAMVVDTHVHRVTKRLGLTSRTGDAAQAYDTLMSMIPYDWTAEDLYELHWLFKGLGQDICTDQLALCGRCPFRETCPRVDVQVRRAVVAFTPQSRSLSQTPNS
jgi:endonuclease-3